ncbi:MULTISPECIES: hypothetical protein [unclassified Vibrio]|uniref:hypothetical protein n=1 Tax=unclassified Vibrio TaxID=2614977 RepID=UPI0029643223|nr:MULTISPECIES: hypothetical protein [unclassified Vibrio]MDW2116725.1 hypothetical protein [Vibrio sp. 1731]MDW3115629.1 hypothetical protein [Vibrio sp. 1727]
MSKNPFSDIKRKGTEPKKSFIESAKVDGKKDKNERRGSSYIDKETGERVPLSGKIIQVPVNGYELSILEDLSKEAGLPIGTYLRNLAMDKAQSR